ncbi:MAG: hypothetical protein KKD01_04525 [Proteobacteria bacterium]|nr:hypothetical protein [Pseudomonadota bacterium]MBU1453973.1 hypothetical protein [Pseudomonadota bacterium]
MKRNVWKRIEALVDPGSFTHFDLGRATGFVTGSGIINGREVYVSAVDHLDLPDSPFDGLQHHFELLQRALDRPRPVVMILDIMAHQHLGKSPFPQDAAKLLAHRKGIGHWYSLHARLSGLVPQVCVVCARLGASMTFPVALCDCAVMLEDAGMSIGRPDVVEDMLGHPVDYLSLGSPEMHARISGSVDVVVKDEQAAMAWVRHYLDHFPSRAGARLPEHPPVPALEDATSIDALLPKGASVPFAIHPILDRLLDRDSFLEIKKEYAAECVTGLARIEGRSFGLVASNSKIHSGILLPDTCLKMSRFITLCDHFSLPLVFLADIPGFMVGTGAEQAGIIRHGAELFKAIGRATSRKLSITLRRNYTAGVYAMAGPGMGAEEFLALPGAVISIYGKNVAAKLGNRSNHRKDQINRRAMEETAADPGKLLEAGLLDEIIQADEIRGRIASFLSQPQRQG